MAADLPSPSVDAVERRAMFDGGSLAVRVARFPDGSIRIEGQDLRSPFGGEYEYVLTVEAEHLASLRTALGIGEDDDVLAALVGQADAMVRLGERTWLMEQGVPTGFSSYTNDC